MSTVRVVVEVGGNRRFKLDNRVDVSRGYHASPEGARRSRDVSRPVCRNKREKCAAKGARECCGGARGAEGFETFVEDQL